MANYGEEYMEFLKCAKNLVFENFLGKLPQFKALLAAETDAEKTSQFRRLADDIGDMDDIAMRLLKMTIDSILENEACMKTMAVTAKKLEKTGTVTMKLSGIHENGMMYLFYLSRFTMDTLNIVVDVVMFYEDSTKKDAYENSYHKQYPNSYENFMARVLSMCYCLISVGSLRKVTFEATAVALLKKVASDIANDTVFNHERDTENKRLVEELKHYKDQLREPDLPPSIEDDRKRIHANQQRIIKLMYMFGPSTSNENLFKRLSVDVYETKRKKMNVTLELSVAAAVEQQEVASSSAPKKGGPAKKPVANPKKRVSTRKSAKIEVPSSVPKQSSVALEEKTYESDVAALEALKIKSPMLVDIQKHVQAHHNQQIKDNSAAARANNPRIQPSEKTLLARKNIFAAVDNQSVILKDDLHAEIIEEVEGYVANYNSVNDKPFGQRLHDEIYPIRAATFVVAVCDMLEIASSVTTNIQKNYHKQIVKLVGELFFIDNLQNITYDMTLVFHEVVFLACEYTHKMYTQIYKPAPYLSELVYRNQVALKLVKYISENATTDQQLETIMYTLRMCLVCPLIDGSNIKYNNKVLGEGSYGKVILYDYVHPAEGTTTTVAAKIYKYNEYDKDMHTSQRGITNTLDWILNEDFENTLNDLLYTLRINNFLPISPKEFRDNYDQYTNLPFHDIVLLYERHSTNLTDGNGTPLTINSVQIATLFPRLTGDLFTLITGKKRLSVMNRLSIMYQMTAAAENLNEMEIAHCDIKPENFLYIDLISEKTTLQTGVEVFTYAKDKNLKTDNQYKIFLADFGLCRLLLPLGANQPRPDYDYYTKRDRAIENLLTSPEMPPVDTHVGHANSEPEDVPKSYVQLESNEQVYSTPYRPPEIFIYRYTPSPSVIPKLYRGYHNILTPQAASVYDDSAPKNHIMMQNAEIYAVLVSCFGVNRENTVESHYNIYNNLEIQPKIDSDDTTNSLLTARDKDYDRSLPSMSSYIFSIKQDIYDDIIFQKQNGSKHPVEIAILQFLLTNVNMSPMARPTFATIKHFLWSLMADYQKNPTYSTTTMITPNLKTSSSPAFAFSSAKDDDDPSSSSSSSEDINPNKSCILI